VNAPGGSGSLATGFTYLAAPSVASVDPDQGATAGGTVVTITGTGLTGASAVAFGGSDAAFTVVSDTEIIATSAPGAGTVDVTVTNAAGSSPSSPNDRFTFVAAAPADPTGGANPVAPHFYNGNVEGIRNTGSETTFYLMQKIADLYTGAGLYGCTLNSGAGESIYNTSDPAANPTNENYFCQANQNVATTDVSDNWDRTEVTEGADDAGSTGGQDQLCGAASPLPVDFARSSEPAGTACSDMVETGYAKDGVPAIDYPVNPANFGTSTTAPYDAINGGVIGPVAQGWLPGDPTGGPYSGTALSDVSNVGGTGSLAYRLWCATDTTRISDWGQLTNLGPSLDVVGVTTASGSPIISVSGGFPAPVAAGQSVSGPGVASGATVLSVAEGEITLSAAATSTSTGASLVFGIGTTLSEGDGVPVGIPIRVAGVNAGSGTEAAFAGFANSGAGPGGGCASTMNTNAANDPNPATAPTPNSPHIALENNSALIDQIAAQDFPSPDYVDQAIEVATTLYIESNGVFNTDPYAAAATIHGQSFSGTKLTENGGLLPTAANLISNTYPTARTLLNIFRTSTVRASTGGFLNWVCDGNVNFQKGLDNSTGKNFDTELGTAIGTVGGFPRLTDESPNPATGTPSDGLAAPNTTCAAALAVNTTNGSSTITLTAGGNFPPDIVNAGGLPSPFNNVGVSGAGIPAGDYVSSGSGTATLTLSAAPTVTGTTIVTFAGVPAVTSVARGGQ